MCGFTGYLSDINNKTSYSDSVIKDMADTIVHRGPDSEGFWKDDLDGIVMGFRRLAILDISPNGNQPMISNSGQFIIVFNGEIYNHLSLRKEIDLLRAHQNWLSSSDTETLLCGFDLWGIEKTIKKCTGMFAFAVWCRKNKKLILGRDRLGEKPLYYGWQGGNGNKVFLFGSELKSLQKHPHFQKEINRDSLSSFLRHSYIPAPSSIYKNIYKLLPGHLLIISADTNDHSMIQYWSSSDSILSETNQTHFAKDLDAVDALENTLLSSVKQQMIADVPIGAFLSGGIDSSLIVSLMQQQSMQKIKTFTIGFNHKNFNEAEHAKAISLMLNTDHSELYIDSQDLLDVIPKLPELYDEPFGDSSQIPTFLISNFAKQRVTVALSGDGGDELFCGYNRYKVTDQYWKTLKLLPIPLRKTIARAILKISPNKIETVLNFLKLGSQYSNLSDKLYKGSNVLASKNILDLYTGLISSCKNPNSIVIDGAESNPLLLSQFKKYDGINDVSLMMLTDLLTYLPDDILTKVDRAAMGVSLETRVPMLDHQVVEFALKLPLKYKLRGNQTKWILRELLYRKVPKELIERPKSGFAIPIGFWLRNSLKDWADDLLNEEIIKKQGFFQPTQIRDRWNQHLLGTHNWEHFLWNVLMFQTWYKSQYE